MADDTNFDGNFDISDLANYLDGGSNSAIPDDLMDQKTEPVKPEPKDENTVKEEPKVKQPDPASFPPTSIITAEGVRKSLRERRASAKLLESGESTIPPKITVSVPGTIPVKPNTITVLPSIETLATKPPPVTSTSSSSSSSSQTPSQQRKPRTPISDIHGTNPSNRRASPPALNKVVPTSPLKQKLKQYVLERQARQAANRTPPRTVQSETAAHKSPGGSVGIENPLIQRRMSQSPSPTNWQQLIQYGRNSPNFIASLSPRSRDALFNIQNKDPRMSPYCRTSPVPADLTTKKEAVSPKPASSKSPRPNTKSPKSSTSSTEDPPIPTTSVQKSSISNPPLFVEPKTYIKEEPIEAPPPKTNVPVQAIQPPLEHSRPSSKSNDHTSLTSSKSVPLQIKLQSGSTEVPRLSKSVPTTPDGGYNTRKIKVQTFALLGKNPKSKRSSENLKNSPRHTPSMKAPQADPPKPPQLQPPRPPQPPKSLDLKDKTPEKVVPKTENLENPFEPVFTSASAEIISPFKDVTSRHLSIPTSFDINFDEADLFNMEVDETETKVEQNVSLEDQEQVTRPPMQADSDLTTPLVGELSLEGKGKDCLKDIVGLDSPFDKRRGKIGRPRSKSTISPEGDERRKSGDSDDRKKIIEPRLLLARSVISETRASKRARSSSEPFSAANIDDDHRSRKQYYYYGEPKATKAIEPLDDHLEFKCNICKKGFPKQSRLETHLKHYHEGKENVADEESDEREDIKITVRCTCDSPHEDRLMIQCDECSQWLHAICIGVNNSNIPSQYICPYCYAIVKQLHDWYEDGNLPRMIPNDSEKPNEPMLQLHDMTDQYHKVSKGITATRLKLDALERSEARRLQDKKDGVWPTNGRKMEGTLVVIPGGGSVLLPNSTQSNTGDPKTSNASLVYVLSPGTAKTSTTTTIGGKTVYTVSRPPLVMSLAQLRQQNPNFRPAAMRGQLRPLSIRPSFRGVQTSSPGSSHRQGVPHVVRGTTLRGNPRAASARYASPRGTLTPPRASGPRSASSLAIYPPARMPHSPATRQPNAGIRPSGINSLGSPRMSHPRLPGSNTTVTRARMPGVRPAPPSIDSANLAPRPGQIRQRSTTSPRVQTPLPRPSPQPGSSPRHHTKSEPATINMFQPTYLSNSRSSSPHLPGNRLTSRSRPVSPRLQRADISQLLAAANNPISSLAAKQFQDSLAQEIADSQDLLEAHISALEKQLDEFERCSEKLDPTLQLGHVLYDLEQLKIFTQTV
ncbi:uncharacterized protein LOC134822724 isoform X2 [Bolinopsis microptera]|uniref:uncharacterized protein LOC134822724 isoform X2 n=1 Tax=Bolinopsis microptera TaxID=2820187 RepID=UPI00307B0929